MKDVDAWHGVISDCMFDYRQKKKLKSVQLAVEKKLI